MKEKLFLAYNKDEVFKNLIVAEGHLRNMASEYDRGEFASCIVKHLADAEGHSDEAISHSLAAGEQSEKWRSLRDMIREFRKTIQGNGVGREEGIRRVREIRRFFESFNSEYDVSSCRACSEIGDVESLLEKLKISQLKVSELEEENVDRTLTYLARKYNVPKPKIVWLEECPASPETFGAFRKAGGENQIVLCRGTTTHVLLHEFGHYVSSLRGDFTEGSAESLARREITAKYGGNTSAFTILLAGILLNAFLLAFKK